jgi:hypothetical protein
VDEVEGERAWREMTQRTFFPGYTGSDAIYDHHDEIREQALQSLLEMGRKSRLCTNGPLPKRDEFYGV